MTMSYDNLFGNYPDIVDATAFCDMLQVSKSTGYKLLKNRAVEHIRIGTKYLIPKQNIIIFLSSKVA